MTHGEASSQPIRAMQSFGAPRPTSNPYIHMLDAELARTSGLAHIRFDRRRALFGRYDVLHFHWPETLFGRGRGRGRGWKAVARRAFAAALGIRLALGRVAVVRTAHNVELPRDVTAWERRYLAWVERRADHRIVLNTRTPLSDDLPATVILHGHYRSWFADAPVHQPEADTVAFVGLVRRYKGVEQLIASFSATAGTAPQLRLRISGNPTGADLAAEVRALAAADARIDLDLRYLSEPDFAAAVTRAAGIVLPYRFMHNSGTVLAALSLNRPVLVPRTPVNEDLAREVGDGWLMMFDGELAPEDLLRFAEAIRTPPVAPPDLSARDWDEVGPRHREAFRLAIAHRRRRKATR